jgi:hypothetical protein
VTFAECGRSRGEGCGRASKQRGEGDDKLHLLLALVGSVVIKILEHDNDGRWSDGSMPSVFLREGEMFNFNNRVSLCGCIPRVSYGQQPRPQKLNGNNPGIEN